jgi:hypothetical protein
MNIPPAIFGERAGKCERIGVVAGRILEKIKGRRIRRQTPRKVAGRD